MHWLAFFTGTGAVPEGGAGKAGACFTGRDQGEGQRLQAQGHELREDEREGSAPGVGGGRVAEVDEEEDRRYGKERRGDDLPQELAFRESRLKKILEAKAALEAEAKQEAEKAKAEGKSHPGVPEEKAQRNFTDPDSRIMPASWGREFLQAYNAQAAVDCAHQVIVAADVTNHPSDKSQALPMIKEIKSNTGSLPREASADAGYFSASAIGDLYALGVDPFIPPDKTRHGNVLPPAPRGRIPRHLSPSDRMRRKLRTKQGRKRYALRMETVETVFGQIKQARGFRQFLLRGLEQVKREWRLICTGHNLLKLFNSLQESPHLRGAMAIT